MPKVYIIVLNYKNWQDTVECLESLFKLDYKNYQIIVVDNNSPNDSIERITKWANGNETVISVVNPELQHLSFPPVQKPVRFKLLSQTESLIQNSITDKLILIKADQNRGYSAGNNIALKYGLAQNDADFFWILNNDVVVEPNALSTLTEKAAFYKESNQKVGIIGGKVMYYHLPNRIQAASGSFFRLKTARLTTGLGHFEEDKGQYDKEVAVDFVMGACMFVSKEYIEEVGLLSEEYFLYLEEPDWVEKGKRKGAWETGYAWNAKIYHKEGGASGGGTHRKNKISFLADFYVQRNKILFTRKFYPQYLPFVYLSLLAIIIKRIFEGQWKRIPKLFSILFNPNRAF
jgi:hypothetical protein